MMKVDSRKFFIALLLFFAVVSGIGIREYYSAKSAHIQKIHDGLVDASSTSSVIINGNLIDPLLLNQITPVEYATYVENLTKLAYSHHMRQIYTVILDSNNTLRYGIGNISTSSANKPIQTLDSIVENKEKFLSILKTNQPLFELDKEEGEHTFYVPHTTTSGIHYLIIAVSEPVSLQQQSQTAIFDTIAKSIIIFLGSLPLLILYRNMLSDTAERLSEEVETTNKKLYETTSILDDRIEEKTKELVKEGFLDPLTHLPNRYRLFYDMDRNQYEALFIIHLTNLQELNHFFGSAIADSLRQQFALFLAKLGIDAYRLGRDEFAILIKHKTVPTDINAFIESLFQSLNEHPFNVLHEKITLNIRIGIDTNEHLSLAHADEALAIASETGEPFFIYDEENELEIHQKEHLDIASSIREAYYDGRIICYYQPIISTQTGKILGYETLARLIDKDASILTPHNFLHIAKKTALYPEISREVIRQACETFQHRQEGFSIHLCSYDITNAHTLRYIEETIVITNTAKQIIFELCEEDIYRYFSEISLFIERMKKLGVRISVDNFGAGYSNLMQLLHLNVDFIKIDGSLIAKLTKDQKYINAIKSIHLFSESLGAMTIAENVEDDETFVLLKSLSHVEYAQGFYIGNPGHLTF
ncbi:MAG: bifunctional diguanylate cyclase/phosphodiesterase [Sulfuricurvum sp.]|nr:bifunctional diguanylate cyclase/phosphodiesterase [Sulfuricurvum sp.]MDD2830275.1 bifunctional diguanylate cyclase/phosphodiesterase [Sulfuricurvum sp.]MDD4949478.1 bifunctional diguanylate cyclase/phosphodiesterase [Sulfuricurvum sp.]